MTDLNTLLRLAQQLNLSDRDLQGARSAASRFEGSSEDEVMREIMKMKDTLTKDRAAFTRQLGLLKSMRPMLGKEQRQKFDQLLNVVEKW